MEELVLLDPNAWATALMAIAGSPIFWGLLAIAVIYIVLNSRVLASLLGRKKSDD
jgi:hypothetical protein